MCNGRRGHPHALLSQIARDVHQLRGVVRSLDAAGEHRIVCRAFTLLAQAPAHDPNQRVEPIHGTQQFGEALGQPVAAADVRELVSEHEADAVLSPVERAGRDDEPRAAESPRHEQRWMGREEKRDRSREPDVEAQPFGEVGPHAVSDQLCVDGEARQTRCAKRQYENAHDRAAYPDGQDERQWRGARARRWRRAGRRADVDVGGDRPGEFGWHNDGRDRGNAPAGKRVLRKGREGCAGDRARQQPMPQRGGLAAEERHHEQRRAENDRHFDRAVQE